MCSTCEHAERRIVPVASDGGLRLASGVEVATGFEVDLDRALGLGSRARTLWLPKGHVLRDNEDYIVTACMFCNTADNQYFNHAQRRGLKFDNVTPQQLVEQRRPYVERVRQAYRTFWEENVRPD